MFTTFGSGKEEEKRGGEEKKEEKKRRNPWQVYCDLLETNPLLTKIATTTFLVCGGFLRHKLFFKND